MILSMMYYIRPCYSMIVHDVLHQTLLLYDIVNDVLHQTLLLYDNVNDVLD